MGKSADDFDEFLALQQISEKRKELERLCRLYAKPGTWDKFIDFEAKMRVQRKKEAEARQRQIAATIRYISWGVIAAIIPMAMKMIATRNPIGTNIAGAAIN